MKTLCIFILISVNVLSAQLTKIRGKVTVNSKEAREGQEVKAGDRVVAIGKKSFVVVTYKDQSRFIFKDGVFVVSDINSKTKKTILSVLRGLVYSYTKPDSGNKFVIKTNNAVMGVRGTKFWLKVDSKESYLCVCDGKVNVSNSSGDLLVERNQDISVSSRASKLRSSLPNDQMWNLAISGMNELGLEVKPR